MSSLNQIANPDYLVRSKIPINSTSRFSTLVFGGCDPDAEIRLKLAKKLSTRWKEIPLEEAKKEMSKLLDDGGFPFFVRNKDIRVPANLMPIDVSVRITQRNQRLLAVNAIQYAVCGKTKERFKELFGSYGFEQKINQLSDTDFQRRAEALKLRNFELCPIISNPENKILDNLFEIFFDGLTISKLSRKDVKSYLTRNQKNKINSLLPSSEGIVNALYSIIDRYR